MKPWTTPDTQEIPMSAEIGGYQDDSDRPDEWPPVVTNEVTAESELG